jgi:ATP-dependent Lon protease
LLFDEIDKMGNDYKGDPASAMLEVLDSNQNFEFRDHYIELPVDLSDVLFITTANTADTIPAALYDRMEIIELSGYTEEEKLRIGMDFLVKKQRKENGLKATQFKINEAAMRDIINFYTRESGVRTLERTIGKICRQVAAKIAEADEKSVSIGAKDLEKYLGQKKYRYEKINEVDRVGIANGLAWTSMGGDTLSIEVNVMRSSGNSEGRVELTGNLGDVMKESAMAAVSYIRSRYDDFGISNDFFKENDIHIHVPEGAVPKDGPSAGITIATSIISAMTGIPIKKDVAMTGEITIRGRILPIGGLKEKSLAARRAGISTILIPIDNEKDLEEIPSVVKDKIKFILAKDMDTVLLTALTTTDFKAAASMRVDLMESLKFKSKNEKEPNVTDNKKIVPAKPRESSIGTDGM